ncbi:exodeoxyribonuclease VII large subunit [Sporolactobacillus shoreicorticis]|uniref:Exodeoxyribonuclease 7 large subunit n=1 Tax=Sporolactobacillus shoreicorticis TaxID=1923877 RepID=A0ABW5SA09_9BACL|nr:exodeoxyribonuclease VII large subunit [Sporolactobacillus shoreicorticis]MCO7126592.1 exodeoxyribonuclease VII large subunit [Sporolactobacillus shoreicorticis]
MENDRYISVTKLTRYIKQLMETDGNLQNIWLRGEISNFKRHSRGHLYLTIKDKNSRIRAVMFAGNARQLAFEPKDGMKVLVQGSVALYEPYGEYQIYIREMQQDGLGKLYLAYEALKKKLQDKGMFDSSLKKRIPEVPYEVGIITSTTGAAIRDLFTTIKRRFPAARITVFPVLVQGVEAAPSIASAINQANQVRELDVLIVGRGGGSIEDLWAFNEEIVADAIFKSRIPVISAVGHETDFTIADFVADKRAPTPTAAGEFAVPNRDDLERRMNQSVSQLVQALAGKLREERLRLHRLQQSYAFRYPGQLILQKEQECDRLIERLNNAAAGQLLRKRERVTMIDRLLGQSGPQQLVARAQRSLDDRQQQLVRAFKVLRKERGAYFEKLVAQLNGLSPLKIMSRGYGLAFNEKDQLIKSVREIAPGDMFNLKLHDGNIDCQVWGIEEADEHV